MSAIFWDTWLIHVCTSLIHVCDMTHLCDMTHMNEWCTHTHEWVMYTHEHILFMVDSCHFWMSDVHTWLIQKWHESTIWVDHEWVMYTHDSFKSDMRRSYIKCSQDPTPPKFEPMYAVFWGIWMIYVCDITIWLNYMYIRMLWGGYELQPA